MRADRAAVLAGAGGAGRPCARAGFMSISGAVWGRSGDGAAGGYLPAFRRASGGGGKQEKELGGRRRARGWSTTHHILQYAMVVPRRDAD